MWEAGNSNLILASHAYADWNCNTLCLLVKAVDGVVLDDSQWEDNLWFKNYGVGDSKQETTDATGLVERIYNNNNELIAWEACYDKGMDPECQGSIEIHANFVFGDTAGQTTSTGKKANPIALDLSCHCEHDVDCQVDQGPDGEDGCYSLSGCKSGECDFQISNPNCCVNDDDCYEDENEICEKTSNEMYTGICTKQGGDVGGDCSEATSCFSDSDDGQEYFTKESQECATPACHNTKCVFEKKDNVQVCNAEITPSDDVGNLCFVQNKCEGYKCIPDYIVAGESCGESENKCVKMECVSAGDVGRPSRTTCKEVYLGIETMCGDVDFFGPCDAGQRCNSEGDCEIKMFKSGDHICREPAGVCDKPDTCSGTEFVCPEDEKFGAEHECRPKCEDCDSDVPEMCPGDRDDCPENVIMEGTLELWAGQDSNAGIVEVVATERGDAKVEICALTKLNGSWQLKADAEAIKLHMCNLERPDSNAGQYDVRVSSDSYDEMDGYKYCKSEFKHNDTVYLAIHLDVIHVGGEGGGETAWAKVAVGDGTEADAPPSPMLPNQFYRKGTRKGPKVKAEETEDGVPKGWGGYASSILCNISDKCRETVEVSDDDNIGTALWTCSKEGSEGEALILTCSSSNDSCEGMSPQEGADIFFT